MCGIAGIVDFAGSPIDEQALRAANATMRHRGPDDCGIFTDLNESLSVGLASVRLAVIDPTPAGHQPFTYADGRYVLSYNGELYNHRELRRELRQAGRVFTTHTDTEVVAAACAQWGTDALSRFNGMFALVFYDRTGHRGFLARDRFGIKPLFVARAGSRLFFASEMTTLRTFEGWRGDVDPHALRHYLHLGYFAAPSTIYAAARRLEPGTFLPFDASGMGDPSSYVPTRVDQPFAGYGEARRAVREALFQAVARRRVADVPLGAFLSGGLDSAIIATHLAQCTPGPIETFSIGFAHQNAYDETPYARLMARHLGSEHHELRLDYRELRDALVPMLDHQGEPFFDSSILPTAIVSQLAGQHVTVCLSGDAGDELFGGYWRYVGHDSLENYMHLPRWLRRGLIEPALGRVNVSKSSPLANRVRQWRKLMRGEGRPPEGRHLAWSQILAPEARSILRENESTSAFEADMREPMGRLGGSGDIGNEGGGNGGGSGNADAWMNRILAFDLRYALPSDMLHKVDLASMYHSLEVRVPFLDPEVVAVAERCPASFKIDRGQRKRILVDAYRGMVPDAILERSKMGFEVPIGEFLRGTWRELFLDTVTRERVESFGLLDWAGVESVYADHCARRGEHADLLFALLSLCWWRMRDG